MDTNIKFCFNMKAVILLGAATLMTSAPVGAAIIHTNINQSTGNYSPLNIDVNGDGTNDLRFSYNYSINYSFSSFATVITEKGDLYANGLNGTMITGGGPLVFGNMIDGADSYQTSNHMADYYKFQFFSFRSFINSYLQGTWNQPYNYGNVNGYLGFELSDGTDKFFGWTNLTMSYNGFVTVNDVAFESCANQGIIAGQTSSSCISTNVPEPSALTLFAIGALSLGVMRRRRKCNP